MQDISETKRRLHRNRSLSTTTELYNIEYSSVTTTLLVLKFWHTRICVGHRCKNNENNYCTKLNTSKVPAVI